MVLEKTQESPWTARPTQSILKEINSEYTLEGLLLKMKLQYFDHRMGRANSLEKTLMLGETVGNRKRGQQRMRRSDSITNSMDMNLSKLWETEEPGMLQSMGLQRLGHDLASEQQKQQHGQGMRQWGSRHPSFLGCP